MSDEHVLESVEKYIRKYFGKRGEHVVQENLKCVREGLKSVMEIPWKIISAPASAKPVAKEEVVFAK
jgi:Pyruvate/2-oxoacid:ferredoxin oxidoreductase gamma subunit